MFLIYLTWRVRQTSDPEFKASMFFSQCSRAKLALLSIRLKLPQLAALSSDAPLRTRRRRAAVPVSPRRPGPALAQRRRRAAGSPRPAACGGAKPERKPPGGCHGATTPTTGPLRRPAANPPAPSRRRQPPRHRLLPSVRPSFLTAALPAAAVQDKRGRRRGFRPLPPP